MKPNVVAPGNKVTSAKAGTTNSYTDKDGTSMAAPHVTGLAATLMDHYPYLRGRPALLRSHLMATAIPHNDVTGKSDDYGLGRVSGYLAHWSHTNNDGWSSHWFDGGINSFGFAYGDVTVPPEPSASSSSSPGTSRRPAPGRAGPSPTTWTCGRTTTSTAATRAARAGSSRRVRTSTTSSTWSSTIRRPAATG